MNDEFIKEYNALCEKYRKKFVAIPQYVMRDDGTFSLVIRFQIIDVPKEKRDDNPDGHNSNS